MIPITIYNIIYKEFRFFFQPDIHFYFICVFYFLFDQVSDPSVETKIYRDDMFCENKKFILNKFALPAQLSKKK